MPLFRIALLCVVATACAHENKRSSDDKLEAGLEQSQCQEPSDQGSCEAAGCNWQECPPNQDCTYHCRAPEAEQEGTEPEEQTPGEEEQTPGEEEEVSDCHAAGTQADCEAAGCEWDTCPPNADCAYFCNEPWEEGEEDPSECHALDTQSSCEAASCDWRHCPQPSGLNYHCIDLRCSDPALGKSQATCEAAGCLYRECPPNADCQYEGLCEDPSFVECTGGPEPEGPPCEELTGNGLACEARTDCKVAYIGFCDCECETHQPGGGCDDCSPDCFHPKCSAS